MENCSTGREIPLIVRFRNDSVVPRSVVLVEMEETEDASLSSPFPVKPPSKVEVVELDLFFLTIGGKILPGSSARSFLCNFTKSPYRLPTKYSSCPFFFTRKMNSYVCQFVFSSLKRSRLTACLCVRTWLLIAILRTPETFTSHPFV